METRDMNRVLVEIRGENHQSPPEQEELKRLLQELLEKVGESGTFILKATSQRLQGRPTLQGISISGMQHNCIVVAYQPRGNDSRYKYYLTVALDKLEDTFEKLKKEVGTAYRSEAPKQKKAKVPVHKAPVLVTEKVPLSVAATTSVPRSFKELTRDEDWLLALRIKGFDLAKQYSKGRIPKRAAVDLISAYEGTNRMIGPLIHSLLGRGVIAVADEEHYIFVETEPVPRQQLTNTALPCMTDVSQGTGQTTLSFAQPFLGNQVVLDAFLRAMGVTSWKPKVLSELLRQQYPEWSPQRTGHVFRHMVKLGLLRRNTAGNYFVFNKPQEEQRMPLDSRPNPEKLVVDSGTFVLNFVAKQPELPRFPLQKIKAELLERLGECGSDFEGTYEVVVGEVDGKIPGGNSRQVPKDAGSSLARTMKTGAPTKHARIR